MALQTEEDFHCPTCLDIFKDPVILPCCHSVCRACVQQWWEENGTRSCPVCRRRCRSMDILSNLALRGVCEAFTQAPLEYEDICVLHQEKLKLFCLDHQASVCLVCRDAKIHTGHKFCPINEVPQHHKEKLQFALQNAKKRLEDYADISNNCSDQAEYIKVQRARIESKIRTDFEELHRFLWVEEEAKLAAVREEEQKKSQMLKEKIDTLNGETAALSDVIRSTEEHLRSDHVSLMKNFQTAMTRIQMLPEEPELPSGVMLDEAKHVGNLKFSTWERMKEMVSYSPVILDPNTAGPAIDLSDDLTSVSFKIGEQRPKNSERLDWKAVLGSPLDSGTYIWDVEVGDNTDWRLGVAWGDTPANIKSWAVGCRDGRYKTPSGPYGSWDPPVKPQRIRVHVDTNQNSVSFSESLTSAELDLKNLPTWPVLTGNRKMYPYFYTRDKRPLKITPLGSHVMIQRPQ